MDEKRLSELEGMLAHQDQQIQDLSDMVSQQWGEIDKLKARLNRTQEKLKSVEDLAHSASKSGEGMSVTEMSALEKPPHY